MAVDPQTVNLMSTYRVGFQPPAGGSLAAGEIYIELTPSPRLWVGTMANTGFEGDVVELIGAPPVLPPANLDAPYVQQEGDVLTSTMGNWTGQPTSYAYQWQLDGVDVGADVGSYTIVPDDVGKSATCTVSGTNAEGTTVGRPSNPVIVVDPNA